MLKCYGVFGSILLHETYERTFKIVVVALAEAASTNNHLPLLLLVFVDANILSKERKKIQQNSKSVWHSVIVFYGM